MLYETTPRQKKSYLQFFEGYEEDEGEPFMEPKDALVKETSTPSPQPHPPNPLPPYPTNKRKNETGSTEDAPSRKKRATEQPPTENDPPTTKPIQSSEETTTPSEGTTQWVARNGRGRRTLRIVNKQKE